MVCFYWNSGRIGSLWVEYICLPAMSFLPRRLDIKPSPRDPPYLWSDNFLIFYGAQSCQQSIVKFMNILSWAMLRDRPVLFLCLPCPHWCLITDSWLPVISQAGQADLQTHLQASNIHPYSFPQTQDYKTSEDQKSNYDFFSTRTIYSCE